jgi:hypothetical protein
MIRNIVLAVVLITACAVPSYAQTQFGIRAGVSADPEQFFFGGHFETEPIIDRLSFRPNLEIGVGDDLTLFAINIEFVYSVPLRGHPWRVYFGGGPAANIYSRHDDDGRDDDGDVEGGFNVLVGLQHRRGLFTEFKVGAIDSPSVKFTVGYVFQ